MIQIFGIPTGSVLCRDTSFYYFCTANFGYITKEKRDNYEKENCSRQLENEYHCC